VSASGAATIPAIGARKSGRKNKLKSLKINHLNRRTHLVTYREKCPVRYKMSV